MSFSESLDDIRQQNSITSNTSSSIAISSISTTSTAETNENSAVSSQDLLQIRTYANESRNWSERLKKKIIYDIQQLSDNITQLPICCSQECINNFTLPEIQKLRYLHCKENIDRKRVLVAMSLEQRSEEAEKKFILLTHAVCVECFVFCTGISRHMIYNMGYKKYNYQYNRYRKNELIEGNKDLVKERKTTIISNFFVELKEYNDVFPDSAATVLPHASKFDVYLNFRNYLEKNNMERYKCHYSFFCSVWRNKFKYIKLRKLSGFTHCDFCEENKEILYTTMNQDKRKKAKKELRAHYKYVRNERNIYYVKRARARIDPTLAVSLIIDGSDMANYGLPHFARKSKDTVVGYKILMKLVGVIVHGIGAYVFIVDKNWSADPNLTIEILHRVLGTIPIQSRVLYVQMDNCARENKNKTEAAHQENPK